MYEIKIVPEEIKRSNLTVPEYLLLSYLRFLDNKPVFELRITGDMWESTQLGAIIDSLSTKGFIRIIDDIIHVDSKTETIFEGKYEKGAVELLEFFNKMKAEHLNITRPTNAKKYSIKFKSLLAEGHELPYIKEVMEYCVSTWKDDDFMRNHINVETFCRHFDKYADKYEIGKATSSKINRML